MKFCLINIAASSLIGILIYGFNRQTNTVAFENLKVVVKSTADFIQPIMSLVIVIVTLLAAISTIIIVLLTSHRIAGPLYRLTAELEKMKVKDLSHPVRVRATDQLQRLARECEAMRIEYQQSLDKIKTLWKSIQTAHRQSTDASRSIEDLTSELERFKTQ